MPAPKRISWTVINFWLDLTLLVVFVLLLWTSVVVRFIFPPPTSAAGWTLWGWGFDRWSDMQFSLICTLALGVLVHVMLHWSWVCGVLWGKLLPPLTGRKHKLPDDGIRTLTGVGLLILLVNVVGVAVAATALAIQRPG